jgi:hypothetical protein
MACEFGAAMACGFVAADRRAVRMGCRDRTTARIADALLVLGSGE